MKGILILSIVFILCSCNEHPKSHNLIKTRPTIEVEHTKHQLPCWKLKDRSKSSTDFFENQVDSIVLIPLENHKDAIIGSVSHVEIVENKLLVVDANKAQQIFVFDMQGNFLHTIGGKGEGPDEYTSINQVVVSPEGICILDWFRWKFLCFDIDGKLRYKHQFKNNIPELIFRWDEHQYIGSHAGYNPQNPYHLTWRNDKDSLLNTGLPIMNTQSAPAGKLQYAHDGSILFYHSLCDTVYQITDKQIIPKWRLGLYERDEVSAFLAKTKEMSNKEYHQQLFDFKKGTIVNHFTLHEGKSHWVIDYQQPPYAYIAVFDKESEKAKHYIKTDFNKMECYVPFVFNSMSEDWICSSLDQMFYTQLNESMQERFLRNIKSEEQREMVRKFDIENKNPIICLFHLK